MYRPKKILQPKYFILFIIRFFVLIFIGFGIFGSVIVIFLNRKIGPTYREGICALSWIQAYLPFILFITAFIQEVTLCSIAMLFVLLWSHAISGPLMRFRKHLRDIAQGKFLKAAITFRTTDQLHDLAQSLSELSIIQKDANLKAQALLDKAKILLDDCKILTDRKKGNSYEFNLKLDELKKIYSHIKNIYR